MNIWVIFWSRNTEHDVSITSAFAVMSKLWKVSGYNVYPIYITRDWKWFYSQKLKDIRNFKDIEKIDIYDELLIDFTKKWKLHISQSKKWFFWKKENIIIDVVFPVLHWLNWEDWTIQWLCELLQVPYASPSIIWSSVWMNKVLMKNVLKSLWLSIVKYKTIRKEDFDVNNMNYNLSYPLFVKPANLGSSIWVSKVMEYKDLSDAIEIAFHYDNEIIIEEWVNNLIELNCSAMEKDGKTITSLVEQPSTNSNFLTFEEKYTSVEWWTMQWTESKVKIPAQIPTEITEQIIKATKEIYNSFYCNWWAPRVDYLYDEKNNKLFVNEINAIPWALQMHLWEKSWIKDGDFLKALIDTAISKELSRRINIDFKSNIIDYTATFINK